ncbi:hypothetical protein MMC17_006772 [Xylographa soralifera]|nr:hypothetical protein [Xylographa soralifera]
MDKQQVAQLEFATKCRLFGRYEEAESQLLNCLERKWSSAVVMELVTMYDRMGLEHKRAQWAREILNTAATDSQVIPESLQHLCKLHIAESEFKTHGRLRAALLEARHFRDWQMQFAVSQYTDIMTAGICLYHAIIKLCKNSSNWLEPGIDGNLPATEQATAISSLACLRKCLLDRKRILEANQIVRNESRLEDSPECLLPFQQWFLVVENHFDMENEIIVNTTATTRVFFADRLGDLGQKTEARVELSKARSLFISLSKDVFEEYNPRLALLSKMVLQSIEAVIDPLQRIDQCLEISDVASQTGETHIQRVFLRQAYSVADDYADRGTDHVLREAVIARRDQLLSRYLDFELDCFTAFEDSSPDFDIPDLGERVYATASRATRSQANENLAKRYQRRSRQFKAQCHYARINDEGKVEVISDLPGEYIHEWGQEVSGATDIMERHMYISSKIILRWVLLELARKQMTESQAQAVLCWEQFQSLDNSAEFDFKSWAQSLSPKSLCDLIYGTTAPVEPRRWLTWLAVLEPWLRRDDLGPSVLHRHNLLKTISRCRSQWWAMSRPVPVPKDVLIQSTIELERNLKIHLSLDQRVVSRNEIWRCQSALARHFIILGLSPVAREEGLVNDQMLDDARVMLEDIAAHYKQDKQLTVLHSTLTSLATCSWTRYLNYKSVSPLDSLKYLEEADEVFRTMLNSSSILDGSRSFFEKHTLAEDVDQHQVYNAAVRASLAAFIEYTNKHKVEIEKDPEAAVANPEVQTLGQNIIRWTQKSKARSLTDVMGLGAWVPTALLSEARRQPSAARLLELEDELTKELESATVARKLHIRDSLRTIYQEMRKEPTLIPVLDIYEGTTITSRELIETCANFEQDVVFVDWIHVRWLDDWDLAILLYRNGFFVGFYKMPIKLQRVEEWIMGNLDPSTQIWESDEDAKFCPLIGRSASRALRQLEALISPLEQATKPGELLVFSPTLALHRVPLHALNISKQPIIVRNPVVYCQSLSLLRLCLRPRIEQIRSDTAVFALVTFSPLANETETAELVEQVASCLGITCDGLSLDPKQSFISKVSQSNFVHFHGHVRFSESDPLEHHIELAPVPQEPDTELPSDKILTAREIFNLQLPQGCHITTISCKSGRAKISQSNELLGLIASFHYAGASSVVTSLWNIHRIDGVEFSKAFYVNVMDQLRFPKPGNCFIDLAWAMQVAVLATRVDGNGRVRALYHWAGLVLNGAWILGLDAAWKARVRSEPAQDRGDKPDVDYERARERRPTL